MASEGALAKRSTLAASRVHWSNMDLPEFTPDQDQDHHGNSSQDSVRKWLTTTEEDAKHEPLQEAAEPLKRSPSSDDDLALGLEASLYGSRGSRTVQEFLCVMDILNLWNDDPEEVLLEMGFGCDEPDLSGRIPARFINYQSQAKGINLQVFLEAQQNRLDLENPDVSNRFRQLEVLQQVTTAFSSLVGPSSPLRAPLGKALTPEAREKRRHVGMLFRRASKKSLSQIHNQKSQDLTTPAADPPEAMQPPSSLGDKKSALKRAKPGLLETVCLSPLAEEQGPGPDPNVAAFTVQGGGLRHGPLTEGQPRPPANVLLRKRSPGPARESFEMEEIHSFDESSVTGSYTGGAEHLAQSFMRSTSCQSDSSGFLEEPIIPPLSQQAAPGQDLLKALSGLLGGSTDSQSMRIQTPPLQLPLIPLHLYHSRHLQPLLSLQTPSDQYQSSSASLPASLTPDSEKIKTEDQDAPHPHLSGPSHDSESTACLSDPPPPASSPSPNLACLFSAPIATQSDSSSGNRESKQAELASHGNSLSDSSPSSHPFSTPDRSCPPSLVSPECQPESDTINPSAPVLDSSEFEEVCPTPPSPKSSSPVCQFSSQCQDAPPVQDVFQRNHLPLGFEDTHRTGGEGGEEGADTVQTPEVYIPDNRELCRPVREFKIKAHSRTEVEPKGLIKIESLDLVFQTSVDGSGSESEDMEAFLERLDNEGRVYWAEPIQVSNPTPEAGSFETPDESPRNTNAAFIDSSSSTGRDMTSSVTSSTTMDTNQTSTNATSSSDSPSSLTRPLASPVASSNLKPSSRSVSVQMSSSPSSHIVHRTDVPFTTHSKRSPLPSVLPLDTSSPFRAVQSWTDLHIQRHTLTQKLSHGGLHSAPYEVTVSTGMIPNPTTNFSSCAYLPKEWESHDYLPGMVRNPMSVSVDKGLWTDEEEEVDRNGGEYEDKLWEGPHTETIACCSSCDQQCTCRHGERRGNIPFLRWRPIHSQDLINISMPHLHVEFVEMLTVVCVLQYSLDELEEMMLCLQQFRSVLSNMEEQLSEDQAAVYSALSDQDSLKMKMHRLLDEQSLLCSQLSVLPGAVPPSSSPASPGRTVATQCCMRPGTPPAVEETLIQSPPESKCLCEGLDMKLDMMGFLQRLKESLRHSVNTDSLE
ncbi:Protein ITPRID1 [Dissostichus eleginoides]|uniref:Protein ITPRID1 n=1 Tax=Dissostichus eleginoides TaxID=100907 RepID=A0AAD9F221_DISEL|nr:Protein ITPRID1 [Dissostichus eleginoides]